MGHASGIDRQLRCSEASDALPYAETLTSVGEARVAFKSVAVSKVSRPSAPKPIAFMALPSRVLRCWEQHREAI